ncbi:MAG TPA: RidA family protein [Steroidobacteraceae bacterium]|nr:RidA family protein [Steroidobacteraceae bacterium]
MAHSIYIPGFSHSNPVPAAAAVGNLVMSGGIHGSDPATGKVAATLDEQCRNIFKHFSAVMEAAGGKLDDIVKVTVWLADPSDRTVLNEAWVEAFPDPQRRPTRMVRPGQLAPGTFVVCDMTAVIGGKG